MNTNPTLYAPPQEERPLWWHLTARDACAQLDTVPAAGLSDNAIRSRQMQYGLNELLEVKGPSAWALFLSQFNNLMVWILIAASVIAGILGEWIDAVVIMIIIVVNAVLGFVQEYRAEKSLAALKKMTSPRSRVLRSGRVREIASKEIVPGDVVFLEAGDRVPADGRMIESIQFRTQEAALTGESQPVGKTHQEMKKGEVPLAERRNMAFMGTVAVYGKGIMLATETGPRTELGRIAGMLQSQPDEKTPLQIRLESLGKRLAAIFLVVVALVFLLGLLRGQPWIEMLLMAVSLAVAAIPEGLPAVVTISLALGVRRMVRYNALIRRLPSVETLGCATVICSDKTGTLTQNEMMVRKIWIPKQEYEVTGNGYEPKGEFRLGGGLVAPEALSGELKRALKIGALCNGARLTESENTWTILGDPTEGALLVAAGKAGIWRDVLEEENPVLEEFPFDSERKCMSILRRTHHGEELFVKGAPDVLLARSVKWHRGGKIMPLDDTAKAEIQEANRRAASQALRVLAVASRSEPGLKGKSMNEMENNLTFAGLLAMMDPPRPEVKQAIQTCRESGIKPVMITGDHKETALAVAKEIGLWVEGDQALSGAELDKMTDEKLSAAIGNISVYARVSAEHKMRIVDTWRSRDAIVAMTGDGVNDAPAVKRADIGVAMGRTGTDVTKEASDMVITDDNFASIVKAIEQGRGIYDNIVKFVKFLLAFNLAEVLVLGAALLIGLKDAQGNVLVPLTAVQILWMNLVTDGLPAVALGVDTFDPRAMKRSPRKAKASMFTPKFIYDLAVISTVASTFALVACHWGALRDVATAQTLTLTTLVVLECAGVAIIRKDYHIPFFSNPWLLLALASSLLLQMLIIYCPPLRAIFGLAYMDTYDWMVVSAALAAAWVLISVLRKVPQWLGIKLDL